MQNQPSPSFLGLLLISLVISLFSCQSAHQQLGSTQAGEARTGFIVEEASQANPQLEDYLNFGRNVYDGIIHLQNHTSYGKNYVSGDTWLNHSPKLDAMINYSDQACDYEVRFGPHELSCVEGYNQLALGFYERETLIETIYGETSQLLITTAQGEVDLDAEIYVPAAIEFHTPQPSYEELEVGTNITWEPDPNFTAGMILMLDYLPSTASAEIESSHPDRISYAKVIPDDGSYTFSEAELSYFQTGMPVRMYLIRGKYMVFRGEVTNASLAFAGYTMIKHNFQMK